MQEFYIRHIAEEKNVKDWRFQLAQVDLDQLETLREETRSWVAW